MTAAAQDLGLVAGQWAGSEVWVVGTGPSHAVVNLADLNARCERGEVRVIAVNHAVHELPDADIVFSKDSGFWTLQQADHPACCMGLVKRGRNLCVHSAHSTHMDDYRAWLPGVLVLREWPRKAVGKCGPWPTEINDEHEGGLVTCGNSGVGALCLADLLAGGDARSTVNIAGLDMDRPPYTMWAGWFVANGYPDAVRTRVVVHGATSLDPDGRWRRA